MSLSFSDNFKFDFILDGRKRLKFSHYNVIYHVFLFYLQNCANTHNFLLKLIFLTTQKLEGAYFSIIIKGLQQSAAA